MRLKTKFALAALAAGCTSTSLAAQDALPAQAVPEAADKSSAPAARGGPPESVFDDNWVTIGVGVAYSPSYTGSDDYVLSPLPVIQGSVGGIDVQPRPAGFALNFIEGTDDGPNINFGPVIRMRSDRANRIKDPVVKAAGELDRAVELGVSTGISFPKLLNPFDSLSFGADVRKDIAGAHGGLVIDPSITYSTPINRGLFTSLTLGTEYASDDFAEYYFAVTPAQSVASGLPVYNAEGGFTKASVTTLVGVDFDGNALNGGLNAIVLGGYSRLMGDAKDNPYTAIRGTADQFFLAIGVGYTF
ncbi:MipA/OmpV family protein [Pontixanthobacter gangjinensis]|uniref:MipA/OmpV family protein n=1 Tax=Pontixanthobacter gangjinensis TaxID=1028742 RepID=A0A6I4SKH2_9SPHN|nr:MipA/OmpV family protein [Pontixanthobacter gangjinensis]MXO56213.1 MipA/OmpV family protein [Pontixanthobacter gangjinensis]